MLVNFVKYFHTIADTSYDKKWTLLSDSSPSIIFSFPYFHSHRLQLPYKWCHKTLRLMSVLTSTKCHHSHEWAIIVSTSSSTKCDPELIQTTYDIPSCSWRSWRLNCPTCPELIANEFALMKKSSVFQLFLQNQCTNHVS